MNVFQNLAPVSKVIYIFFGRCRSHLTRKSLSVLDRLCQHVPFVVVLTVQLDFAYFFWLAYGTMAFLLGPLRTWSVLLGIVLWHQTTNLSERSLQ
jgi:hypothetical protein